MLVRLFREAGAGDGGGGISDVLKGLDGFKHENILDAEAQAKKDAEAAAAVAAKEGLNDDGTVKEGYIKGADGKVTKDPNYKPATPEGVDAQGNPLPGYKKDEQGKIVKDPDYKDPAAAADDEVVEVTPEAFLEEVGKVTGREFKLDEIKFPEGVDPLTPQGIAHLISYEREQSAIEFETALQRDDPRSYAYMLHRANGGTDEEFFATGTGFQLPDKATLDASADMQAAVYKADLKSMGLDTEAIDALVEKAIKDNKLKEKADASYTRIDTAQKEQVKNLALQQKAANEKFEADLNSFSTALNKTIKDDLSFVVPEAKMPEFRQYLNERLRYDNTTGKFTVVEPVDGTNMKTVVEALLFQYLGTNINALVQKAAKTKVAQNNRMRLGTSGATPGEGSGGGKSPTTSLPLSAVVN